MKCEISIDDANWKKVRGLAALTETCLDAAIGRRKVMVSVLYTDDKAMRSLNRSWRGKDKPTNVLSFPAADAPAPRGEAKPLGDIVLAYGVMAREAAAQNKTLKNHVAHLLVHGALHLLGYDHEDEHEAVAMERRETRILARLGIADPYAHEQ